MKLRRLLPIIIFAASLVALYLFPQTSLGRSWLLGLLTRNLAADTSLRYLSSSGNLWSGLKLSEVELSMPGLELKLKRIDIGYFLPSLFAGELPLSLSAQTVRGSLDFAELTSSGEGGGGLPIRPVLQNIDIQDVALNINDAPFTLPNLSLSELDISNGLNGLELSGIISNPEGRAELTASVKVNPFELDAQVSRADISLAQHWWPGAESGTASGSVTVRDSQISADLRVSGGEVLLANSQITAINGIVSMNYPLISAELSGQALGGPLSATGTVDVANYQWQAKVAGNPALADTALWLAGEQPPFSLENLAISGTAETMLELSGWQAIELRGKAQGRGNVAGQALEDLSVNFGYSSSLGSNVDAKALFAGGPLSLSLQPAAEGYNLELNAREAQLFGIGADLNLSLKRRQDLVEAEAQLEAAGALLGRELTLSAESSLGRDGLQLYVSGNDALAGSLEGNFLWQDNRLQGQANVKNLSLPFASTPLDATLSADGTMDNLPLELSLDAVEPLFLQFGDNRLLNDLRGNLTTTLTAGRLSAIEGRFGALSLNGELSLSGTDGRVVYSLAETALEGQTKGEISLKEGNLTLSESGLIASSRLITSPLQVAFFGLPALDAVLDLNSSTGQIRLSDITNGLLLIVDDQALTSNFQQTPLQIAGNTAAISGELTSTLTQPLDSLELELNTDVNNGQLRLSGDATELDILLSGEPGLALGPLTLAQNLSISGTADLGQEQLQLAGLLGLLELELSGKYSAPTPQFSATLNDAQESLRLELADSGWSTQGSLPLTTLAQALGLELSGQIQTDLAKQANSYEGQAQLVADFSGIPLELELNAAGSALKLQGNSLFFGQNISLTGQLLPEFSANLKLGESGDLELSQGQISGGGTLPKFAVAGLNTTAQTWQLQGDMAQAQARLSVGESRLEANWAGSGWQLDADILQTATWAGLSTELEADARFSSSNPDGRLEGALKLQSDDEASELTLWGSLADLRLAGVTPAALLFAGINSDQIKAEGNIDLQASARLSRDFSYNLSANWREVEPSLNLEISGNQARVTATIDAEGLNASWQQGSASVKAGNFDLGSLLGTAVTINGQLDFQAGRWSGELNANALNNVNLSFMGAGDSLLLEANSKTKNYAALLAGQVLPVFDLKLSARALDDLLELNGDLTGPLREAQFVGSVSTAEISTTEELALRLPPQSALVRANYQTGLNLQITNDNTDIKLVDGLWSGDLSLNGWLKDQEHNLTAQLSGSLPAPELSAELSGPLANGSIDINLQGLEASLSVDPDPWLPDVSGLETGRLQADLESSAALVWQLKLSGNGNYQAVPLNLEATFSGENLKYSAQGTVTLTDTPIPWQLMGNGAAFTSSAEFAKLELSMLATVLPVALNGELSGQASLDNQAGTFNYEADLAATGTILDNAFDLKLTGRTDSNWQIEGVLAGANIRADGDLAAKNSRITVDHPLLDNPFSFTGELDWTSAPSLKGQGQLRQLPLSLTASFDPADRQGLWEATWGEALWRGQLLAAEAGSSLVSELTIPAGMIASQPFTANLSSQLSTGQFSIESFELDAELAQLKLSGTAWPETDLNGTLALGELLPVSTVTVAATNAGYRLAAQQQSFNLQAFLSNRLSLQSLETQGALLLEPDLMLDSNLSWQAESGFEGTATVGWQGLEQVNAKLSIEGDGQLALSGQALYQDNTVAELKLVASDNPWQDPTISGQLDMMIDGQSLTWWPGEALSLSGQLGIDGNWTEPLLSGPLQLAGALNAAGSVELDRQGARAQLAGDGLSLSAGLNQNGWQAQATAKQLDLSNLLPQLNAARLAAAASATQNWGEPFSAVVSEFSLASAHSLVSGSLLFEKRLSGVLNLDLDLADIPVNNSQLRGRLQGPLVIGENNGQLGSLSGLIEAESLGLEASDWGLGGNLQLSGSLSDPQLELRLNAQGSAQGQVSASIKPRQAELQLSSNLSLAGFSSDINILNDSSGVTAQGGLGLGGYRLVFADPGLPGQVLLEGREKLATWRLAIDFSARRAGLSGYLSSLAANNRGQLELAYSWADGISNWLSGNLSDLSLGNIALGNLELSSSLEDTERRVIIEGENLAAAVLVNQQGLSWQLSKLALGLPAGLELNIQAEGDLNQADLRGEIGAELIDETINLPFAAKYQDGLLSLSAKTNYPGEFALETQYQQDSGWQGRVSLSEAELRGVGLELSGTVSGPLLGPRLLGSLALIQGENKLSGNIDLSPDNLSLQQRFVSDLLAKPLDISGNLWPNTLLTIGNTAENQLRIMRSAQDQLQSLGRLELDFGWAQALLQAAEEADSWLKLSLSTKTVPGLELSSVLPSSAPGIWLPELLEGGWVFYGSENTSGSVTLWATPQPRLQLDNLAWQSDAGTIQVSGQLERQDNLNGLLQGRWQGAEQSNFQTLPGLTELKDLPFDISVAGAAIELNSATALGELRLKLNSQTLESQLEADLSLGTGQLTAQLDYKQSVGPQGELNIDNLAIFADSARTLKLSSQLDLDPRGLSGIAQLRGDDGSARLSGGLGWQQVWPSNLQKRFLPQASNFSRAELRLDGFDLKNLPVIARRLPYLDAPLSGIAQLQGQSLAGQFLSPELSVFNSKLPSQIEFNGSLASIDIRANIARSRLNLSYDGKRLAGLFKLEQFPLHALADAIVGDSGVTAIVTADARLDIPLATPGQSVIRLASERIRLERDGVITQGDVAFRYENGNLLVDLAEFEGEGSWQASGQISPQVLSFNIEASEANLSPILGLIPPLAAFDVGAQGSLNLQASGSLAAPSLTLNSPGLDVQLGGSSYRLNEAELSLQESLFSASALLRGVSPLGGELKINGDGNLDFLPSPNADLSFRFSGDATVPALGNISNVSGEITAKTGTAWQLDSSGVLGRPFTLSGSLAPLDLRLSGEGLNISAPDYYLASSEADVAMRLLFSEGNYLLSGDIFASQAQLALKEREQDIVVRSSRRNPLYERILFDNFRLRAPQQIRFQENFGSAELGLDLSLGGSVASPEATGEARALRGNFRFSGRNFDVESAVATFEPSRGAYPLIFIEARTSYDKAQVLSGAATEVYEFTSPRESSSFEVVLIIAGEFEELDSNTRRLKLEPTLQTNALIQLSGAALGPRPLTQAELVSLLTLGRLELSSDLIGESGLASSVAQSALDTAVDLLVLSELQTVLGEALGVDLLEIRTSSLSSLINSGGEDPFGVSLRVGGYVSEDVFASYEIGRFSDPDQQYAFSNEFSLRYDLAPLELSLSGRLNFLNDAAATPVTEFSTTLGYAFTPQLSIETGIDLSSESQALSFGVSYRW